MEVAGLCAMVAAEAAGVRHHLAAGVARATAVTGAVGAPLGDMAADMVVATTILARQDMAKLGTGNKGILARVTVGNTLNKVGMITLNNHKLVGMRNKGTRTTHKIDMLLTKIYVLRLGDEIHMLKKPK